MKLLIVLEDLLLGGAQLHSLHLAEGLRRRGMEVEIAVLGAEVSPILKDRAGADLLVLGQRGLYRPGEWRRMRRALAERGPDVMLAVNPVAGAVVAFARRRTGGAIPAAAVFHSTRLQDLAGWVRTGGFVLAARSLDALVYVSEAQRRHWMRRGLRARETLVIGNATPPPSASVFDPRLRAETRKALGFGEEVVVFGSLAMFRPEKNQRGMVRALAALRASGAETGLLLVGDGPTRAACEAEAARLGLDAFVRFVGEAADPAPFLAAMDVGLLASTAVETLPLFGLEAMAAGRPLVAPRLGGLAELVDSGREGLLFPPGRLSSLTAAMGLCLDPLLRRRMGEAARLKAARFGLEAMVDGYAALLRRLGEGG